jgi:hypothetical protein
LNMGLAGGEWSDSCSGQILGNKIKKKIKFVLMKKERKTPWPESTSKLYRPRDCRLSVKIVPTFADRWCHEVSVMDPSGFILGFLDHN